MFFKMCDAYTKFLNFMIVLLGVVLIFSVGIQVAGRYIWFIPLYLWPLEVTNIALIWAIFIGSSVAIREGRHFIVDIFGMGGRTISPTLNFCLRILYYVVLAAMTYVFIYYGFIYVKRWGAIQESEVLGISMAWLYASVPFAGVTWLLFMIEGIIKEFFMSTKSEGRS